MLDSASYGIRIPADSIPTRKRSEELCVTMLCDGEDAVSLKYHEFNTEAQISSNDSVASSSMLP